MKVRANVRTHRQRRDVNLNAVDVEEDIESEPADQALLVQFEDGIACVTISRL